MQRGTGYEILTSSAYVFTTESQRPKAELGDEQTNVTTGNVATPAETEIACRMNGYSFGILTKAFCPVN